MSRKTLLDDDASQYASIQQRLRRLEQGIPEDVHYIGDTGEPAFQNSWTNYDPLTWSPAGFYRASGRVWLQGLLNRGASTLNGSTMFTLPAGYQPAIPCLLVAWASLEAARVNIYTDGQVILSTADIGTGGSGSYLSIEGLSFRHA